MLADTISGGYIAGNIAVVVVTLACIALAVVCFLWAKTDNYDRGMGLFFGGCSVVAAIVSVVAWIWSTWPFKYDYHHWVTKQGVVTKVSSRLVSDGDSGVNQRFVVVLADGGAYGVDDTRASLLKAGDHVRLKCKKEFEWGTAEASQGWGCKWAGGGA